MVGKEVGGKENWEEKEREREKRREMNLSKTRKLAQLKRAGKFEKDARSGTSLKLGRSKKNCVELLKNVQKHQQNLWLLPMESV